MNPIPPHHHDQFLNYLNDFIQSKPDRFEVCLTRAVSEVWLTSIDKTDYTIIDFKDGCTLIIPGVYSQFEGSIQGIPPKGAA